MLEMTFNPTLKYYEAPLQLKANNGTFIVDDFGRQEVSPQVLLDRWIIPLENRQDFLYLNTGQKFAIPFDQFLIFATNLDPANLLDPAFLRRIRSKVKVRNVDRLQYVEIFRLVCEQYSLDFNEETVNYLLVEYDKNGWPMAACHPRDLIEMILNYSRFHKLSPTLSKKTIDRACSTYFVK
jgi:SpoVK/Ycf46/Vps4 family AAA+-type ATPase